MEGTHNEQMLKLSDKKFKTASKSEECGKKKIFLIHKKT